MANTMTKMEMNKKAVDLMESIKDLKKSINTFKSYLNSKGYKPTEQQINELNELRERVGRLELVYNEFCYPYFKMSNLKAVMVDNFYDFMVMRSDYVLLSVQISELKWTIKREMKVKAKTTEQPTEQPTATETVETTVETVEETVDNSIQVVYNEIKENNKEEKVESVMLNNQVEKNIQVEIIDYTRDYVYYYEDVIDAQNKLEHLYGKFPNNEIGVSHFTVYGVDIEWNEENIDFVEKSSPLELEAVVKILEHGYANNKSLVDVALYIENSMCYSLISGEENKLNAFIELVDDLGGVEFIENKDYYVDLEYLKRDYELSGDEIVQDMSQDEFEKFVYDCDLLNNDTIEAYFDYEKYMRDFELSGSSIIELENKNFLFIF